MSRLLHGRMAQQLEDTADMWGFMYKSFVNSLGVDPKKFQLVTPFVSWDWPTASLGHTDSREYEFISSIPQWSGVGSYAAGASRLSDAYELFLMALVVSADPVQKLKIEEQQNVCANVRNNLQRELKNAREAYTKDPTVSDNTPDFASWLTDELGEGYGYGLTLAGLRSQLNNEMDLLDQFIKQSNDPTIKAATEKLSNQSYWTSVDTDSLDDAFTAPGYLKTQSYVDWVSKVQAGGGNSGLISWSNSESHYDWKKSWASGKASYGNWFWAVEAGGGWEREDSLATSKNISVEISFEAWDTIPISDAGWFDQPFVKAKADGEYRTGFSRSDFFGEEGGMALRKTGMLVVYKPSFSIKSSTGFSKTQREKFEASGGLRIGPFRIGGGGGSENEIRDKAVTANEFSGGSNSETPMIAGVNVKRLG